MYNTIQKTIAAWAFNHYIAYYYFDNVNVSQLKVAFEKGEVELEDLPIKKDALKHFDLPLDVLSGEVGKLSIKVPLLTILTDPWVIKISKLMLIVAPRKHPESASSTANSTSNPTPLIKRRNPTNNARQSESEDTNHDEEKLVEDLGGTEPLIENGEFPDSASFLDSSESAGTSEESKLAEFYSSFSATVSSMVKDIYKNIRLEIESTTILFEDFDRGLMKFNIRNLLLHRPKSVRNLLLEDVSIYLSSAGIHKNNDLIRLYFEKCTLDIHDEGSKGMELVPVQVKQESKQKQSPKSAKITAIASEIKVDGTFSKVSIERLTGIDHKSEKRHISKLVEINRPVEGIKMSERNILKCDLARVEFKFSICTDDDSDVELFEKNLHLKMDIVGLQYIHSQRIYEITMQRLINLLKLFKRLLNRKQRDRNLVRQNHEISNGGKELMKNAEGTSSNKLLNINIEDGLLYVVEDSTNSCAIPLLEFSLEDLRIFQFSEKHEQNGFIYAKVGCNYFNRETSNWEPFLEAWPFNVSWDLKSALAGSDIATKYRYRKFSLSSDELAHITLSSGLLDLGDIALRRILADMFPPRLWPLNLKLNSNSQKLSTNFNSLFVLHNESGHKLHFAPLEHDSEIFEVRDMVRSPAVSEAGDEIIYNPLKKLSLKSNVSKNSRDSPELVCVTNWIPVGSGQSTSFEFRTIPIYRRQVNELINHPRLLLLRVEGWKTLYPIPIENTGLFSRKACADRVSNVDTNLVISIDLEQSTARKIISVRSPLNLVNQTDLTLEIYFAESHQALYIKPGSHLPVPLPFLFNSIHLRPCSVGVTMSEQYLLWDEIREIFEQETRIHTCNPIAVTDQRHASYCSSRPHRICVSIKRENPESGEINDTITCDPVDVFTLTFLRHGLDPLTKIPKKSSVPSPHNYKLASYNHNANLAGRIAGQAVNLFNSNCAEKVVSDLFVKLPGLRVALIDNQREKFAEACVNDLNLKCSTNLKAREQILDCEVGDIRIYNLLTDCEKCVVLDRSTSVNQTLNNKPAVRLIMDRVIGNSYGSAFFKQAQLTICDLVLNIEEKLMLKFIEFISFKSRRRPKNMDNHKHDLSRIPEPDEDRRSKYYFDMLRIDLSSLKLSVFTSYNLPASLQRLKSYLGLKFFGFEDAQLELSAYTKMHVSKTFRGVFESVAKFYMQQIYEQAPRIVGQQIQNYLRFHLSDLLSTLYDEVYNKLFN